MVFRMSLIAAKGYNIDSLSVAETLDPSVSRMTLSLHGDEWVIEQAVKQLHRLIDVIKVMDLTDEEHIGREMVFVRVNAEAASRAEILRINEIFRGVMPYIWIVVAFMVLMYVLPEMALWLPRQRF